MKQLIIIISLAALSFSAQGQNPPMPQGLPPIPPGAVAHALDLSKIPKERIAYEVICQNPHCLATSVLKPVREGGSGGRSVEGGSMVQSWAQFTCPKCKQLIFEQLPEHFVPRHPARMVILPEQKKSFIHRVLGAAHYVGPPLLAPKQASEQSSHLARLPWRT